MREHATQATAHALPRQPQLLFSGSLACCCASPPCTTPLARPGSLSAGAPIWRAGLLLAAALGGGVAPLPQPKGGQHSRRSCETLRAVRRAQLRSTCLTPADTLACPAAALQAPPARQLTHCVFLAYKTLASTAPSCRVWLDGARAVSGCARLCGSIVAAWRHGCWVVACGVCHCNPLPSRASDCCLVKPTCQWCPPP